MPSDPKGRKDREDFDLVDLLVRIGGALGANEVRLRWKLIHLGQSWRRVEHGLDQKVTHVRYQHKVCPSCGSVQDRGMKVCSACGEPLGSWGVQVLERVGLALPQILSVSSLLGLAIVLIYARMIQAQGGGGILSMEIDTLMDFGAHFPPAVWSGEWWRLGTAIFLHIGLWHLAFNLFALSQVGPSLEEVYGRHWTLFFFMLTGLAANLGSELLGLHGVAAGASGALMGLVGVATGWGQREGTSIGKELRNRMLKWGIYTLVFNFFIEADNGAHAVGFVAGAALGYLLRPQWLSHGRARSLGVAAGAIGLISAVLFVSLALHPPLAAFLRFS